MTHIDYCLMFFSSFFVVFLLGVQSRNVNQGRYYAAVVTSFGISVANFTFVKYAATGSLLAFWVAAAGGCIGIACAIWFSKHVIEPRRAVKNPPAGSPLTISVDIDISGATKDLATLEQDIVRVSALWKDAFKQSADQRVAMQRPPGMSIYGDTETTYGAGGVGEQMRKDSNE